MAKPGTRLNTPDIKSVLFTSDPAFLFNQINKNLPSSYLRGTEKLANPTKPKSTTKQKVAAAKATEKVSGKKVSSKKGSAKSKKESNSGEKVKAELPEVQETAKEKAKSIQASRKKKTGNAPKLELKKSEKRKTSQKAGKNKVGTRKAKAKVQKEKSALSTVTKATRSKSKKSTIASKSIVMSTKKTTRKQIKEEGQVSKFALWLQKLDAPQSPSTGKKTKAAFKRPESAEINDIPKKVQPTKPKKKSVGKSKNPDTSIKLSEDIISETLADLLAKQGHTDAAREMYEKLSLINPKKSGLFASKIENLLK